MTPETFCEWVTGAPLTEIEEIVDAIRRELQTRHVPGSHDLSEVLGKIQEHRVAIAEAARRADKA